MQEHDNKPIDTARYRLFSVMENWQNIVCATCGNKCKERCISLSDARVAERKINFCSEVCKDTFTSSKQ